MVRVITSQLAIDETPPVCHLVVSAGYEVHPDVIKQLGPPAIRLALEAKKVDIKTAFQGGITRAYLSSGIVTRSGALKAMAENAFDIKITVGDFGEVLIEANWPRNLLPYFEIQLFGGKAGRNLSAFIPPHQFIKFDGLARTAIAAIIRRALRDAQKALRGRKKRRTKSQQTREEELFSGRRRVTLHQIRRQLRKSGFSAEDARTASTEIPLEKLQQVSLGEALALIKVNVSISESRPAGIRASS